MYDVDSNEEPRTVEPEPRPRRREWQTATERAERAERPSPRLATFAGGASAQQMIAIRTAWDVAVSPCGEAAKTRAVAELLRAAADAKWTAGELCAWVDTQVGDVKAARTVVMDELRARLATKERAA